MRRSIVAWIMIGLGLGCWVRPVYSASDLKSILVSLTVVEKFGLEIDETHVDLGEVAQGQTSLDEDKDLRFSAATNHGTEWFLQMKADPLTSEDGSSVIPADNLQYTLKNAPLGSTSARGRAAPVPTTMRTIYVADPSEYSTSSADFNMGFKVSVPDHQKTGKYSTTIHLCMADTF